MIYVFFFFKCKYKCMWFTVDFYSKNENMVIQFYGKWPFIRIFGIQEPFSALASLANLLTNVYMFKKMKKQLPSKAPFKALWYTFAFISINTWLWSTVFHTRDFNFTQKMDYYCAFSLVIFQFYAFFVRILKLKKTFISNLSIYSITFILVYLFLYHIFFLSFVTFDYGYNMKINIVFGTLNSLCWLFWSLYEYIYYKKKHMLNCTISIICKYFF